jgi:hypothetical protein
MCTLQAHPRLAKYVRELHWTVLHLSEYFEGDWNDSNIPDEYKETQRQDSLSPSEYYTSTLTRDVKQQALYRMFRSLVNLAHIGICWLE